MEELDLKRFAKLAWAKKIFIVLIMIASIVAGCFYSYVFVVPKYKSTTTLLVAQISENKDGNTVASEVADFSMTSTLLKPYISLLESKKVLNRVNDNLGINISEEEYKKMLSIVEENQAMISLSVMHENADFAEKIANQIANVFVEESKELFNISNVNIIDKAEKADEPYNVNHAKDLIIFGMLGVFLSCCLVFLIYMLDTTVKEEEDIEETGLPILGTIPVFEKKLEKNLLKEERSKKGLKALPEASGKMKNTEIVILDNAKSPVAEAFRALRTNVTFAQNTKTILVTSSRMGEGKSYVTANLAATIAKTDKKVIIVDADMRKGRQNRIFGLDNKRGLSNYLANCEETKVDISELTSYIRTTNIPNLHVITSGSRPSNPAELLSAPKIKGLISVLSEIYDIILIDGTPSSIIADSVGIARYVDYAMLVTAYKTSKTEEIKKLLKTFEQVGVRINGAVLNKYPLSKEGYTSSYYYSETRADSRLEESGETEIRTVENFLEDANINSNSFRYIDMKDDSVPASTPSPMFKPSINLNLKGSSGINSGIATIGTPSNLEYKLERIDNEITVMKNMVMQIALNTNQINAKDIELIRYDISNLKQTMDDLKDNEQVRNLREEVSDIKNLTEVLVSSQNSNNEKIKKFIEDFYKQKEELTKKATTTTRTRKVAVVKEVEEEPEEVEPAPKKTTTRKTTRKTIKAVKADEDDE